MIGKLRRNVKRVLAALARQPHDDAALEAAWDNADEDQREFANMELRDMIARSTGSINNSYLKAQISTALQVGLLAVFFTAFGQGEHVVSWLYQLGMALIGASIGLSLIITTPRINC